AASQPDTMPIHESQAGPEAEHYRPVHEAEVTRLLAESWGTRVDFTAVTRLEGDMTCDGHADVIHLRVTRDDQGEAGLDVLFLTAHSGQAESEQIRLPFQADNQAGLCGAPAIPPAEFEPGGMIEGFCEQPLRLEDPECDWPRLYWIG